MDDLIDIERLKRLAIIGMFSDDELMERLVLKGGNLLDIVYEVSTRASVDLDFSIEGKFETQDFLRERVTTALCSTFAEAGYVAFDFHVREVPPNLSADLDDFWGGYKVDFKILAAQQHERFRNDLAAARRNAIVIGPDGSTKLKIDISRHEHCSTKQAHNLAGYTVYCYSPEMVVGEKLRAICQQMPEYVAIVKSHPSARARDFVDIFAVDQRFAVDFAGEEFYALLRGMFGIKRVPLRLLGSIQTYRDYHRQDFVAVRATIRPSFELKEFDYYFDYVLAKVAALEPLWHK